MEKKIYNSGSSFNPETSFDAVKDMDGKSLKEMRGDIFGSFWSIEKSSVAGLALNMRDLNPTDNPLIVGQKMTFKLECEEGAINQWYFLSAGKNLFGKLFEPNVEYTETCVEAPSAVWGPYVLAANVKKSTNVKLIVIESKGIVNHATEETSWLKDKKAWCLGDSLTDSRYSDGESARKWMAHFATLSKADIDLAYQAHNIAMGGTRTLQGDAFSGQMRAKKLLAEKSADVIFIQNINDAQYYRNFGNVEDEAFMTSEIIQASIATQSSETSAKEYFYSNMAACTSGITKKHGVIVKVPYSADGLILTLSGAATKSGTITLKFSNADGDTYGIEVNSGDSIATIIDKIVEWDFFGRPDAKVGDNQVSFANTSSVTITNGNGELGVTITQQTGSAIEFAPMCFVSHNLSDWSNAEYWKPIMEVSLIAQYKGLIEYIMTQSPKTKVYMLGFPRLVLNYTDTTYKRADGTWNWDKFRLAYKTSYDLMEAQKAAAEWMNIIFVDAFQNSNINIYNMQTYYYGSNNVHFNADGYDKLAEIVFNSIK